MKESEIQRWGTFSNIAIGTVIIAVLLIIIGATSENDLALIVGLALVAVGYAIREINNAHFFR